MDVEREWTDRKRAASDSSWRAGPGQVDAEVQATSGFNQWKFHLEQRLKEPKNRASGSVKSRENV